MAKKVLKNRYLMIASTDMSNYIRSADLKYSAKPVEATCDGDFTEIALGGLLDWSLDVELAQDYDAAAVDSILFPLVGTAVAITLRPENAIKGVNNPEFTGSALLADYPPLAGKVGDLAVTKISLKSAGTLSRAVA